MTIAPPSPDLVLQTNLNAYYMRLLAPPEHYANVPSPAESETLQRMESCWLEAQEHRCLLSELPARVSDFVDWYRSLSREQTDQSAKLFNYLAESSTAEEMALYICLEEQVDGRFDDVIALAQVGLEGRAKLALARNYWDEMGNGSAEKMHTHLFRLSSAYFQELLQRSPLSASLVSTPEALMNGNILLALAINRRYSMRLLGALTLLEQTAPYRFSKTTRGMRRLGIPPSVIHYHELHIRVDARHGRELLEDVLLPMFNRRPELLGEVATGMLLRCNIATDYYAALSRQIGIS